MKKSNLIVLVLLLIFQVSLAQNESGIIYYGHKIGEIAIDTSKVKNESAKSYILSQFLQKKRILSQDNNVYKLSFHEKQSLFEPIKRLDNDANSSYVKAVPDDSFFTDLSKNEILRITSFSGEDYIVEQNSNLNWEITGEQKKINNYLCQKATVIIENSIGVKTKVTAWFTKDIPLNYGPREYSGLPGLIVELNLRDNIYYLRDIIFKDLEINQDFEGKPVSNKKYQTLFDMSKY
ncbi:GLPGLI family protein [Psychroflexus sp. S27]|uniref:GLPGLI family protein n=1 Tax=Psychroflexus sp. S27 TaxID=1982757 RepID=UPI0018647E9B|nr:GLPGLI family protein [Psychroflexus sp. S27]